MERCLVFENITGYLKNHWNKHRLVCTHFDAFSMLISNMGAIFKNSDNIKVFYKIASICKLIELKRLFTCLSNCTVIAYFEFVIKSHQITELLNIFLISKELYQSEQKQTYIWASDSQWDSLWYFYFFCTKWKSARQSLDSWPVINTLIEKRIGTILWAFIYDVTSRELW